MAFEYDHHMPRHGMSGKGKLIIGVIAVVIIAVAAFIIFGNNGVTNVGQSAELHITNASTLFTTSSGEYMIYLGSSSGNGNSATVYLGKLPTLLNPLLKVSLNAGNSTRVNVGTSYANLGIVLNAAGKNSADITVTSLDPNLQISPDSLSISLVQGGLGGSSSGTVGVGPTSNITTTTVPQNLQSQSTTVATTTISEANVSYGRVVTAWMASKYYPLMVNYTRLYKNTTTCTADQYNSTFIALYGFSPKSTGGAATFENVSIHVPYNMYSNITNFGGGNYKVTYYTNTKDSSFNNTAALTLVVNASNEKVLNYNYTGVFQGQQYQDVLSGYQTAVRLGPPCGIDVG